jgi:lipopolysaccharide transport system permease protein
LRALQQRMRVLLQRTPNVLSVAWMIARRDIVSDWRASRLSVVWPLLFPLGYTALFVLVRPVVQGGGAGFSWSYVVFVFVGFSLWQLWFEGLRTQMEAVRANRSLLSRADLSPVSLFLAGYLLQLFQLSMRVMLALVATIAFVRVPGLLECISFVALAALVVLNGCVIGFLLQPFSTLLPDVAKALQSTSLALLVTGGVFFAVPTTLDPLILNLLSINPLAPLIDAARASLFGQSPVFGVMPWVWITLTILGLALQAALARKVLPVLLERIGA